LIGEDGMALVRLWWDIARDETRRDSDRLEASRLLAERGWGKAPAYAAIEEGDPLDLADAEKAAEESGRRSCGSPATPIRTNSAKAPLALDHLEGSYVGELELVRLTG
jgi:hypothetical protein